MSVAAKHWALSQTVTGGSAPRVILFFLADWVIGDTQVEAWPSIETLVFETGMNRKTVMKALSSLEEQGLIAKRVSWYRDDKSPRRHNVYQLVGYDPIAWKGSLRPTVEEVPNLERTENRTSQKRDVPDLGRTEFGTSQIRTVEVPNLDCGGTKSGLRRYQIWDSNRESTGNIQGKNREEGSAHASACPPAPPLPDTDPTCPLIDHPTDRENSETESDSQGGSAPVRPEEGSAVSSREDALFDDLLSAQKPAKAPRRQKRAQSGEYAKSSYVGVEDVPDDLWNDWCLLRKRKHALVTQRVIDGIAKEAAKAGITLTDAFDLCVVNGWSSIKADWSSVRNRANRSGSYHRHNEKPPELKDFRAQSQQAADMEKFFGQQA